MVRTIGDPTENVKEFLACRGIERDDLLQVAHGEQWKVLHAVATGSVAAGFANPSSDIDLMVVTEGTVMFGHSVSHELGHLVDIAVLGTAAVEASIAGLERWEDRPLSTTPTPDDVERETILAQLAHLCLGAPLCSSEWVATKLDGIRESRLPTACARFWQERMWRRLFAIKLLPPASPPAVACAIDAGMSALKAVACLSGFVLMNPKFLALELNALGRDDLLTDFRRIVRADLPRIEDVGPGGWPEAARRWAVGEVESPEDAKVGLTWSTGVDVRTCGSASVVSMWDLNGCLVEGELPPTDQVVWEGGLEDRLDHPWPALFSAGLVTVEVVGGTGGPQTGGRGGVS